MASGGPAFNVGTGSIVIVPQLDTGFRPNLQRQLNTVQAPTISVNPQLDPAALTRMRQQINGLGGTARVNVDTSQAQRNLGSLRTAFTAAFAALSARSLLQQQTQLSGLSNHFTLLAGAATSAAGAITPVLGLVGGLGAGFAVAGAGVGAFAALAKPQLTAVTTATQGVSKAQDAYNTALATGDPAAQAAALKQYNQALAGLTPAQRQATLATLQLKSAFKAQSDALAPVTLGVYTQGLHLLTGLLPAITPVARAAGDALSGIFTRMQSGLGAALSPTGGLGQFLDTVKTIIGPVLNQLSVIVVNLGRTFSNVFQAFVPLIQPALGMIRQLTGALAAGSASNAFYDFVAKLRPLIAPLGVAIHAVAGAFGSFINAAVPLAGPVLDAVILLGNALRNLFQSADFHAFVANIGSAISSLAPVFSALVGPIGQVLQVISGEFAALAPQLVPIITQFAQIFSQVLVGLSPLLSLFVQLAGILVSFLPVLYPLITAFRQALVPILQAVGQALIAIQPAVGQIVQAFVSLLPPLGQLFAAIVPIVAELLNAFAPVLTAILNAVRPLIPVITQVAVAFGNALLQVVQSLVPFLPPLVNAFVQILIAVAPLIPSLLQLGLAFLPLITPLIQIAIDLLPALVFVIKAVTFVLNPLIQAFTWWVNFIRPAIPWILALVNPFFLLIDVIRLLVGFWTFAWNTVIFPAIRAAAPLFIWLYQNVVLPVFSAIQVALAALGTAFSWFWNVVLQPVFRAIAAVAQVLGTILIAFVFAPIKAAWLLLVNTFKLFWDFVLHPVFNAVAAVAGWLYNNVLKPIFGAIQFVWRGLVIDMKWAWDNILHPMFHAVASVVGGVRDAFGAAVGAIHGIWDGLKKIFSEPINIVIFPIVEKLSQGVDAVTDFALGKRPLQGMEHLPRFAQGGIVPGNHSRDDVPIFATPGEVVVPKPVVSEMGGPAALMGALGFGSSGGGPGSHFLLGGLIHDVTHNPLTDAVGSALGAVGSAAKTAGGWAFNAADWALEKGAGFIRAGAADALDGAYKAFSGPLFGLLGKGQIPTAMHSLVNNIEGDVISAIRGKEQADVGDYSGGPGQSFPLIIEYMRKSGIPFFPPTVGMTTGGGHATNSYHYRGMAVDFSGGPLDQIAAYWHKVAGSLLEEIHTPGYYVKNGQDVGPGFYGPAIVAEHTNHVHVAATIDAMNRLLGRSTGPAGEGAKGTLQNYAEQRLTAHGWGSQFGLLDYIIQHESNWQVGAHNASGAYGIPQALPGSKMSVAGADWRTNGFTQLHWMIDDYIPQRYGSLQAAYDYKRRTGVYDDGGMLPTGLSLAMNATGRPEPVFSGDQWDSISAAAGGSGRTAPLVHIEHFEPKERADVDLFAAEVAWRERQDQT
jgi:phage-related protein